MMERYRATKIDGVVVVRKDKRGNYRAETKREIDRALTDPNFETTTAQVIIGNIWRPLRRQRGEYYLKPRRKPAVSPSNRRGFSMRLKILKILERLHLYKDPLEELFYNPERDGVLPKIKPHAN
jgi:hypothetical protein